MTGLPRLPGPCGPGPGNEPVEADTYQCSLGLGLQATLRLPAAGDRPAAGRGVRN